MAKVEFSLTCVLCEPLMVGWFVLVLMIELDFYNECNDLVVSPQLHLVYRPKV